MDANLVTVAGFLAAGPATDKSIHRSICLDGFFNSTRWLIDRWVELGYLKRSVDNDGEESYELTPFKGRWIAHAGRKLASGHN